MQSDSSEPASFENRSRLGRFLPLAGIVGFALAFAAGIGLVVLLSSAVAPKALDTELLKQSDVWLTRSTPTFPENPSLLSNFRASLPVPTDLDANLEAIGDFSETSSYREAARSVGRVDLIIKRLDSDYVINPCTGTIIDPLHVLTAYHCTELDDPLTSDAQTSTTTNHKIIEARLVLNYVVADGAPRYVSLKPSPVEGSRELDYAIFEINGDNTGLVPVKTSAAALSLKQDLFILHHPLSRPLHLSRKSCRNTMNVEVGADTESPFFRHSCGTLPGTSGAPIFDYDTRMMIGIHVRGDRSAVSKSSSNEAFGITLKQMAGCGSSTSRSSLLAATVCPANPQAVRSMDGQ